MHEMALMVGVFEIIKQHTAGLTGKKVTRVTLVVGEMTNAVPEALELAFEVYASGTIAQEAELDIKEVPLKVRCQSCGWAGTTEKYVFVCPQCSSLGLEIIAGRELYVESLEVD